MENFKGKVGIVTGSARGIGKAVASKFAEYGADVIMMDINEELLVQSAQEIADTYGVKAYPIRVDAMSTDSVNAAMEQVQSLVGSADILANCAGISTSHKLIDVEDAEWDRVFNINLRAVFTFSKLFARQLQAAGKTHGHIVSISSQASKLGEYGNGVYSISKAGVNMLTQILGLEFAELGITVNAVCPGYVNTEMMQEVFQKRGPIEGMTPEEYEQTLTARIPFGRMCEPSEVAELMAFLASDRADYITGVTVTVAGGSTLI
ncbi:MAG: SDR family oxidoreductase [Eubacteriales bacterium]|nr:SDR family oxidoreductase [Eubacteriales bacterium]